MPGIFDHLSARLQEDRAAAGLSPLDLAELPDAQKQLMLTMLRDPASGFEGVTGQTLHEKLDSKVENVDDTLALLTGQGWLIALGEPSQRRYRVSFRTKRGSTSGFDLWNILTDRLPDGWKGTENRNAT